jgi:hypothetical protein
MANEIDHFRIHLNVFVGKFLKLLPPFIINLNMRFDAFERAIPVSDMATQTRARML